MSSSPNIIVYFALLLFVARFWWRRFREHRAELNFTFRITDIWFAMLGLLPSIYLAGRFVEDFERNAKYDVGFGLPLLVILPSQIVGLMVGRVHFELYRAHNVQNALSSGVSIATGALLGLICCMGTIGVATLVQLMFQSYVSFWIFLFIVAVACLSLEYGRL